MNFITKFLKNIIESDNQIIINKCNLEKIAYQAQIDIQNEQITELKNNYANSDKNVIQLTTEKNKLLNQIKETLDELNTYKKTEKPYTIPTDIIDTTKFPYLPSYTSIFLNATTKKLESKENQMTPSKFYREWTDEMYQFVMNNIKGMTDPDLIKIKLRDLADNRVEYKSDLKVKSTGEYIVGENWKPAHITWDDKAGDCEDSTILWVCFCAIANIPADEVFNATGFYNQFGEEVGHSWGVTKFKDNNWYVIETTAKKTPVKLLNSDYRIPLNNIMNGLSNWAISGKSKKEQF
jgi:transglutaminase-like putative cysteine protease